MAKIVINGVTFVNPPTQPQTVDIKYRLASDPDVPASYTTHVSNLVVPATGVFTPAQEITGLTEGNTYVVQVVNKCSMQIVSVSVPISTPISFVWVADTFVCEDDNLISVVAEYTNFSSPNWLYYNTSDGLMYGVDIDENSSGQGNIFWFNPGTMSGVGSVTYSTTIVDTVHSVDFDVERNKIYLVSANGNGLIVFNMTTKALETGVSYGSNGLFSKLFVRLIGNTIYAASSNQGRLLLINPDTKVIVQNYAVATDIPDGQAFTGAFQMYEVGSNVWVCAGGGRTTTDIKIYNSTLTSVVATISLVGTLSPSYATGSYHAQSKLDSSKNRFYYYDTGSNQLFILNTQTQAVLATIPFTNREGKLFSAVDFTIDEVTNKMLMSWSAFDDPADSSSSQKKRTYIINRDTLAIERVMVDVLVGAVVQQNGSIFLWGTDRGTVVWSGEPSWASDGKIIKLSY